MASLAPLATFFAANRATSPAPPTFCSLLLKDLSLELQPEAEHRLSCFGFSVFCNNPPLDSSLFSVSQIHHQHPSPHPFFFSQSELIRTLQLPWGSGCFY
jgi:hypothetical protein